MDEDHSVMVDIVLPKDQPVNACERLLYGDYGGKRVEIQLLKDPDDNCEAVVNEMYRSTASIQHPNVLRVYGPCEVDREGCGRPEYGLAVDETDGDATVMWEMSPRKRLRFIAQLAAAVEYLHSIGIVGLGIKLSRVRVKAGNCVLAIYKTADMIDHERAVVGGTARPHRMLFASDKKGEAAEEVGDEVTRPGGSSDLSDTVVTFHGQADESIEDVEPDSGST